MVIHQIQNLHLPMIIGAARDLSTRLRRGGLGRLAGPPLGLETILQPPQRDDWWQRYVYDTTQGALRVLGARYGEGEYYPVDDPRYRQVQQQQPTNITVRPTSTTPEPEREPNGENIKLTTNQVMLIAGGILLYFAGKRGR